MKKKLKSLCPSDATPCSPSSIVEFIRRYNRWRRGDESLTMESPKAIGDALDAVCSTLDQHANEIQGWQNKWECAVEMAAQAEAKLAIVMDVNARLNDYVRVGGMICEPTTGGDYWELGRSEVAYCIDGQGDTLIECLMSVSRDVWHEVSPANV